MDPMAPGADDAGMEPEVTEEAPAMPEEDAAM